MAQHEKKGIEKGVYHLNINTHQNYIKIAVVGEHKLKLIAISSLFFSFLSYP
jgi:hypothetical protein